ncbi:MAG: SprB repeat-containing protein [Bacteroidota bacterium]
MKITLLLFTSFSFAHCFSQVLYIDDVQVLGNTINSESDENHPLYDLSSNVLFFSRTYDKKNKGGFNDQDVFVAQGENATFTERTALSSINSKLKNAIIGISTDGKRIYVLNAFGSKADLQSSIAMIEKKGTKWGKPQRMEIPDLKITSEKYSFHVSADEKTLLIAFNGSGTYGEEDLYVAERTEKGWTSPVNLGPAVNSKGSEIAPFLSKGNDTLFYSSNGHQGLGDYDIFYAVRKGSWTNWSAPVHLGGNVNTPKFDGYFSFSGNTAYWSSDFERETGDIFTGIFTAIPALTVSCIAQNASINKGSDGSVNLTVNGGLSPYEFRWSNGKLAEDISDLTKGDYSVTVIDAAGQEAKTSCIVDEPAPVVYEPVDVNGFKNLEFIHYFNYNENKLTVAKGELKKFIKEVEKQLKDGRIKITINVYSSASQVPTTTYETNEQLTQLRAENMKYDLANYFNGSASFAGKVNVAIVTSIVDGPVYVKDFSDKKKYKPYQFVGIKTE